MRSFTFFVEISERAGGHQSGVVISFRSFFTKIFNFRLYMNDRDISFLNTTNYQLTNTYQVFKFIHLNVRTWCLNSYNLIYGSMNIFMGGGCQSLIHVWKWKDLLYELLLRRLEYLLNAISLRYKIWSCWKFSKFC